MNAEQHGTQPPPAFMLPMPPSHWLLPVADRYCEKCCNQRDVVREGKVILAFYTMCLCTKLGELSIKLTNDDIYSAMSRESDFEW